MTVMMRRLGLVAGAVAMVALASGCTRVRGHQGYIMDKTLAASIQPGVDNRESVLKTLGQPSFEAQFDTNAWYYFSRTTRQYAFSTPNAIEQNVFKVSFDPTGTVAAVETTGMAEIASINPSGKTTPTLGRDRSFFEEIFGNIGRVGAPGMGGTNPGNDRTSPDG